MNAPYLAGIIDGEGNIYVDKRYNLIQLDITNTNLKLLKNIQKWLKNKNITSYIYSQKRDGRKTTYHLRVYKQKDILKLYKLVEKYLMVKRLSYEQKRALSYHNNLPSKKI